MAKKESFLVNRIKSVGYAFRGFWLLIKTESSIKVQAAIALLLTIAGFVYKISEMEWLIQILAIGTVMGIEGINTAIEEIADFIHPEYHNKIRMIKDISAGAVFIISIFSVVIALIIYVPKIF